ncbi:MAG TPA: hypothetical protein DEO65_19310 [Bacillus bacterium]|uniref:YwdI family protein n=1 Tax=Siminovitchia fordii TaxID=254759 RepID=A0ABQ4KA01_9BACI|nr:YwdI family protein [Siminovitchia fordii]GIN22421.1 hypothetical protein J1TS3_35550 [Siminovitchia fordii]HBZ11985.1 hypothetical protein [Bacillus sp. (in: firmicutes)]
MHITYKALIGKMESELKKAKEARDPEQMRGHLFAVKALAELTLDTGEETQNEQPQLLKEYLEPASKEIPSSAGKYHENHGGGDSILDF